MLVATRDPMPDTGTQVRPVAHGDVRAHAQAPRTAGIMTAVQLAGSLLAIPVALGSAYTVYQANFSPDTQCQALRASIIAMIDKKIDATTRRMLVRRDVDTFEKTCGGFDPDAKAAFVSLLAEPRPAAPKAEVKPAKADAPKAETKVEAVKAEPAKTEAPVKDVARKPELRSTLTAKAAEAEAPVADINSSDARWLEAVRGALVTHEQPSAPVQKTAHQTSMPLPSWVAEEPVRRAPAAQEAAPTSAPALPAATAVPEPAPSVNANDPDRPVPPAAIPSADQRTARSTWISNIPFVGQVLDK